MVSRKFGISAMIETRNQTKKYGVRAVPIILLFIYTSAAFTPALAQYRFQPSPVMFDKDSYRPGETVTMYGTIIDAAGKPVEGAKVVVDAKAFDLGSLEAITNSDGNWTVNFEIPDGQEFGTWPVDVTFNFGEGIMRSTSLTIKVGEVEAEGDVENEVESLKEQIAELKAKNQMLQGRVQELEEEIRRLHTTSSGVSYGTLGVLVSGAVVICLAVFFVMYQRSIQGRKLPTIGGD